MVGPSGERWVPVHGFLPHSKLSEAWDALGALYARHCDACSEHHLEAGAMFAAVSPSAALIEPVFFWHDSLNPLHREAVEPAHLARLAGFPENRAGRDFVAHLRGEVIKLFQDFGAAHLQVARTYPLRESHDPRAWALLKAIKAELDPKGLMNPGSLGL
jgi:FAD/FMN-containing dehydrogenase